MFFLLTFDPNGIRGFHKCHLGILIQDHVFISKLIKHGRWKKLYEVAPERTSGAGPFPWSFRRPYLRKFSPDFLDNKYLSKKARLSSPMQTQASGYDLRQFWNFWLKVLLCFKSLGWLQSDIARSAARSTSFLH